MKKLKSLKHLSYSVLAIVVITGTLLVNGKEDVHANFHSPMFRGAAVACRNGQCSPFKKGEMTLDMANYQWDYQNEGIWDHTWNAMRRGFTGFVVADNWNVQFVPTGATDDDGHPSESSVMLWDFYNPSSRYYNCSLSHWAVIDGIYNDSAVLNNSEGYFAGLAVSNPTNIIGKTAVAVYSCPNWQ